MKQLIRANPALLARVKDGDAGLQSDKILLDNGWTLGAFSSTDASAQGVRIAVAVLDEVAYMPGAGKENSDVEIVGMVRRGQIGLPDGVKLLVKISTPRGKSGVLYEDFTSYFSKEDPIHLVWKAT